MILETAVDRLSSLWDRWLLALAALLLAATFLHPTLAVRQPLFDYVLVIDITQSMNAQDYTLDGKPVSRLDYVKHGLRRALPELPCGSRVGWGIFTEYRSFLLFAPVEVCANYRELTSTLEHIDGRMAWSGNSEIAKGLYGGIKMVDGLEPKPALVFITDGQEAPPLNPRHRPPFDGKKGETAGLIIGAGGLTPLPIPKVDPAGRPLGFWRADEVLQTDPRSLGRGASVTGEKMADSEPDGPTDPALAGQRGSEHLSSLREPYLRLLASETGLAYHRLEGVEGLVAALTDQALARETPARADLRHPLAGMALAALLAVYVAHGVRLGLALWPGRARIAADSARGATADPPRHHVRSPSER